MDQHKCTTGPNSRDHDHALNCLDEGPAHCRTRWPWFIYPGKVAGDPRWGIIIWVASGIFSSKTSSVTSLGRPFSTRVRVAALPANEAIKWSHQHIKWRCDALPTTSLQGGSFSDQPQLGGQERPRTRPPAPNQLGGGVCLPCLVLPIVFLLGQR